MTTDSERFNATVGRQLRAEIAASGGSLSSAARDVGLSRSALDNYVTGKRAIPVTVAYDVCETLGIDVSLVILRAEERFATESVDAPIDDLAARRVARSLQTLEDQHAHEAVAKRNAIDPYESDDDV